MKKRLLVGALALCFALFCSLFVGQYVNQRSLKQKIEALDKQAPTIANKGGDPQKVPGPVSRYFSRTFRSKIQIIRRVEMEQEGTLRTDTASPTWMPFNAKHLVYPAVTGFVWDARIAVVPLVHLNVRDELISGRGSGRIILQSAFPVAESSNTEPMNLGSMHRFLAESVWYPTALLPGPKLRWTPIDEDSALATLSDRGLTVSLVFRFNKAGEATGVYTPGRWGSFEGGFKQVPWEGHFSNYREVKGMLVPMKGEVGWYSGGQLHLVWKGTMTKLSYEFESSGDARHVAP